MMSSTSSLPRSKVHAVNGLGPSSTSAPSSAVVCADCGTPDPQWASLNRGVLICAECCNVHRSLGRHVSQVRSMKKGNWHSWQLALVFALYKNGVNNIWEHSLLDPQSSSKIRRKPTPRDPVYPTKAEFIRAKYEQLAFSLKPGRDDDPLSLVDLNCQLYSCVRTSHIETTLRLLSQGADPNYVDPERGTTPLHVAAKEGQTLQVELLFLYGADPGRPDSAGITPSDAARLENLTELANRLEELKFEMTDRLTMYLCDRKPDHAKGRHFLIPELAPDYFGGGTGGGGKRATGRKLHSLSMKSFERLVQDVYDEVDRREVDSSWQQTMLGLQPLSQVNEVIVPFLPVNQDFSATRNQSRQKLAKFGARDFAALIIDVLNEARRRYLGEPAETDDGDDNVNGQQLQQQQQHEQQPQQDVVEARDYDFVPDSPRKSVDSARRSSGKTNDTGGTGESSLPHVDNNIGGGVPLDDYLELRDRLSDSETRVEEVARINNEIMRHWELRSLHLAVDRLADENVQLRMEFRGNQLVRSPRPSTTPPPPLQQQQNVHNFQYVGPSGQNLSANLQHHQQHHQQQQQHHQQQQHNNFINSSVPATAHHHIQPHSNGVVVAPSDTAGRSSSSEVVASFRSATGAPRGTVDPQQQHSSSRNGSAPPPGNFDARRLAEDTKSYEQRQSDQATGAHFDARRLAEDTKSYEQRQSDQATGAHFDACRRKIPLTTDIAASVYPDNLIFETEQLTVAIKGLLSDAQHGSLPHASNAHAVKIGLIIDRLVHMVPVEQRNGHVERCLAAMVEACRLLKARCNSLPPVLPEETCQAAYGVAKSAKLLLTAIQESN